jgi:thymidylate synthase
MSEKSYLDLLDKLLYRGTLKPAARENMPSTSSLFGEQIKFKLSEGFPLLTTKKLSMKNISVELLWFLKGDTNIKYLLDHGCNIWNEDAYNYYLKQIGKDAEGNYDIEPMSFEKFVERVSDDRKYEKSRVESRDYNLGDCGFQYGKLWRDWGGVDQIKNLIEGLVNNPMSRRHILTAWNPSTLDKMALNACHAMVQFNCRPIPHHEREDLYITLRLAHGKNHGQLSKQLIDDAGIPEFRIDCQMYQRSADVFLGVPYNIASYSLLTHIIAELCNFAIGDFIHTFGDVHLYENHQDQAHLQSTRQCKTLPRLMFSDKAIELFTQFRDVEQTLDGVIHSLTPDDFEVDGYDPHPRIKAPLSTGLIK